MIPLGEVLARHHRTRGDHPAVIDSRGVTSYREFVERGWSIANGLLVAGLRRGEPVAVLGGNRRYSAEVYAGVAAAGGMAAMLNWRWSVPELVRGIHESGAQMLLADDEFASLVDAGRDTGELGHLRVVVGDAVAALGGHPTRPDVVVAIEDPNVMLFTGGTTGFSKGVVLTHANVMANALNEIVDTDMTRDDVTLCIAPMHHSASLLCWFLPHVVLGATTVLQAAFDEAETVDLMARHRVTNGFLVPTMVRRLLASGELERRGLPDFGRLYVGGAAFTMPDKVAVREVWPDVAMYYQYGLTEAGPIVTRLRPEDMFDPELDGSIGREFWLNEVTIREAMAGGLGAEVPDGDVGEICVRGPNVMAGYHGRPEATAEVLVDGWLRTGDAAARGPRGELWFRDRYKDVIKSGR
ncbi:long-chain fatty acid--CoA ligase [soil metagenome]